MSRSKEFPYEHPSSSGITIAFKDAPEVVDVTIVMYRDSVPPGMEPLERSTLYYKIDTTIEDTGKVEIRILAPFDRALEGEIHEWTGKQWEDRTSYSVKVGHYTLVVGEVDHLSGFGIR
jgi:hypothetical protein